MKKIPLNLKKIIKNNSSINIIEKADTRESNQNLIINPAALDPVKAGKKKKRVSFKDQFESKKDLSQTIDINDRALIKEDNMEDNIPIIPIRQNLFFEYYRKQCTSIDELNKKENDVYKIQRPKKYDFIHNPQKDIAKERCSCILF